MHVCVCVCVITNLLHCNSIALRKWRLHTIFQTPTAYIQTDLRLHHGKLCSDTCELFLNLPLGSNLVVEAQLQVQQLLLISLQSAPLHPFLLWLQGERWELDLTAAVIYKVWAGFSDLHTKLRAFAVLQTKNLVSQLSIHKTQSPSL